MAPKVQPPLLSFISDQSLALLLPIIVYWVYSLFFYWISHQDFPWLERYRIHRKDEEGKNKVALADVIKAVIVQQLLQTALGFIVVLAEDSQIMYDDELSLTKYSTHIRSLLSLLHLRALVPNSFVERMAHICYYYIESISRFGIGMFVLDTWQYFLHRLFHTVPYLYRNFHSYHHRLIVIYPFGAIYNHPVEGFLVDSIGASVAFLASGMGNRGALALFSFSTLKTLDDHCGYNLPYNPLQKFFSNNSNYHDIHHQPYGFKKNFSQPFGSFWDHILGTHMSREEANAIVRKKEERRRNRQAFNVKSMDSSNRTKEKSSYLLSKHDSVRSSGDNCRNVSQEDGQSYHVKSLNIPQNIENRAGLHERPSTRIQFDNGFVSGKGQGKAL